MGATIGTIIFFWLILAIPGWLAHEKHDRKINQIQKKQEAYKHDYEIEKLKIQNELKIQLEKERLNSKRILAVEKEQLQQEKEIEKIKADLEKLKHDVKILKYEAKTADQEADNLRELHRMVTAELEEAYRAGNDKRKERALRKINTLNKQLATAVKKGNTARFKAEQAQKKIDSVA